MNDLIDQIRDSIAELECAGKGDYDEARSLRMLMLETLGRLALALAIDEVTRPDNYLAYLSDDSTRDACRKMIKDFFAFRDDNRVRGTLGDYLWLARELLKAFNRRDCPESVRYIDDLICQTSRLVYDRNVDGHERADYVHLQIGERIIAICDGINTMENPYLNGEGSVLMNIYPATFRTNPQGEIECNGMVRGRHQRSRQILKRELLRLPSVSSAEEIERAAQQDIMSPIALHNSALYMMITLPSGATRLHLLSPLIVFLPDEREYAIYHRRQSTWFHSSVYIRVTGAKVLDVVPAWDTNMLVSIGREERLKSISWEGELFADEGSKKGPAYSETFTLTTDRGTLKCNINARRFPKSGIYPGFWNVLYMDNEQYFNVPIYDRETLQPLYRMFDADNPPLSNPLYVYGLGGVGKTHTVLNTLREQFIAATALSTRSMQFKHIIFLTAKQISFNTSDLDSAVSMSNHSDFSTADEALKKLLTILRDREVQESKTEPLIKAIRNVTQDPMLIIVDDLDSVVAPVRYDDSERQRQENYREQCRLAEALHEIVRGHDMCRIIVTTRRPLDEVGSLHLRAMTEEQSLNFARRYYKWCDPTSQMPNQYIDIIRSLGKGIPAYVGLIVHLLNHSNHYGFTEAQTQQFRKNIADFSLFTTLLSQTGMWLLKAIECLSNVFAAIPIGLLRIIFFDEKNEDIDDAIREMVGWDMIEIRSDSMIAMRDDSQLLWNQLYNKDLLQERHGVMISALFSERELLDNFALRVGELLIKVFQRVNDRLPAEKKQSLAIRVRELIQERNPFLTGLVPQQQNVLEQWMNMWGASAVQRRTEQPAPAVRASGHGEAEGLLRRLKEERWSMSAVQSLLACFAEAGHFDQELSRLWEQTVHILPECIHRALTEHAVNDSDVEKILATADMINTAYSESTGKDLSEYFACLL
ncbi:MAG: ATP-binding protein [Aristaeellaceae bacterium]